MERKIGCGVCKKTLHRALVARADLLLQLLPPTVVVVVVVVGKAVPRQALRVPGG
jgi:hypothetical protein